MRAFILWMTLFFIQSDFNSIVLGTDRQPDRMSHDPSGINRINQEEEIMQSVFPNPFTPNNDGFNDYVEFTFSESIPLKPVVHIFNLRGKKVCELNPGSERSCQWDGKDRSGNDLEPGVYIYIINSEDGKSSNGTVTLIR